MGERNCAVDGCNALEFRTTGICNLHLSMGVDPLEDSPSIETQFAGDHRLTLEVVMSYGFLIGLVAPAIPAIVLYILLMFVGPIQDIWIGNYRLQSQEIFLYFMWSLILWPLLAFVYARETNKSRKNMSTGLLISSIIGMVVGAIFWLPILAMGGAFRP